MLYLTLLLTIYCLYNTHAKIKDPNSKKHIGHLCANESQCMSGNCLIVCGTTKTMVCTEPYMELTKGIPKCFDQESKRIIFLTETNAKENQRQNEAKKESNESPYSKLSLEQKVMEAILTHPTLSEIWKYMVKNNPDLKFLETIGGLNVTAHEPRIGIEEKL